MLDIYFLCSVKKNLFRFYANKKNEKFEEKNAFQKMHAKIDFQFSNLELFSYCQNKKLIAS